ncbi:MAG: magnesium transporter, partial [Lachnospiraceae bacterium]|nr:magnesium transporter [Lachnospiraceae bacterium]
LEEMDADDAVDILEQLPEDYRDIIVEKMDDEAKEDIALITSYEEGEVGSLMTTNFVVIERGLSVKGAMKELIRQSADNDNISTIYVIEPDGTFYGAIDLKDLIRAREGTDLESIITTSYPFVGDHDQISEEIERLRSYSEDSIPVLDEHEKILGVLTATDLVEAVDDELGEDYAKLAGLTEEEDLNEPLFKSVKKRLPWLIALLGFGLIVSSVVGVFQGIVAVIPLVICFQSLILDMAGNSGTQSLAVTIRVLTDESLSGGQKLKFLFKEMRVGFTNGCILGLSAFGLVGGYIILFQGKPASEAFLYSGCVGLALWTAMIVASMVGTLVPMFFTKIKVDPAVASGPLITTINDLIAVVTYYGMAGLLLVNVFHLVG